MKDIRTIVSIALIVCAIISLTEYYHGHDIVDYIRFWSCSILSQLTIISASIDKQEKK